MERHETLVAVDWNGANLDIGPVLDFIGDALVIHDDGTQPHWRTGEPQRTHRVTFNARQVRNTEVAGRAYHCGFVSHIE